MYLWLLDDVDLIQAHHKSKFIKEKYPEIYKEFKSITFPEKLPFFQLFWHFINDDPDLKLGLCPICGKRCKFNFCKYKGYRGHCSYACLVKDKNALQNRNNKISTAHKNFLDIKKDSIKEKRKNTCVKKYGTDNYTKTLEFKNKLKDYWLNRSEDDKKELNKKIFNTKLERYGDGHYTNINKIKETLLSHNDEFWQEVKTKTKSTCLKKYGCESYSQTNEFKNKIKEIWDNKTDDEIDDIVNRCRQTTLELYGFDHYMKTTEGKERLKQVFIEKYGVDNSMKLNETKEKIKQTNIDRYGVEYFSQTNEFAKYHRKQIEYDGLTFDSSWEVMVYQYCKENNIPCEYQPNVKFEYTYNNKIHYYQPDFLIDGQLYEVKGEQFFEGDKMICPYNRSDDMDNLVEAKHQCIIKNNVIILRGDDIKRIKEKL